MYQRCKRETKASKMFDDSDSDCELETSFEYFPNFWYKFHPHAHKNKHKLSVQEVDASNVLMMSSFCRYSLSRVHDDLWYVCGIHTDIWNVETESTWYYERKRGVWQLMTNYL